MTSIYRLTDAFLAKCDPTKCAALVMSVLRVTKPDLQLKKEIEQVASNALRWQEIYAPFLTPIERETMKEILKISPSLLPPSALQTAPKELIPAITEARTEFSQLSQSGFYPFCNLFKLRLLDIIENLITIKQAPKTGKFQIEVESGALSSFKDFIDTIFADCIEGHLSLQTYLQKGQQAQEAEQNPELDLALASFTKAEQKIEALQRQLHITYRADFEQIKIELTRVVSVLQKEHRKWLLPIELQPLSFSGTNGQHFNSASVTMLQRSAKVAYFCLQFFIRQRESEKPPTHLTTSWQAFVAKLQKLLPLIDECARALAPIQEMTTKFSLAGNSSDFASSVTTALKSLQNSEQLTQKFADAFCANITDSKDRTINRFADAAPYPFSSYCLPFINLFMLYNTAALDAFAQYWKNTARVAVYVSSNLTSPEDSELIYFDKFFWWQKHIFDLLEKVQKDLPDTKRVLFAEFVNNYLRLTFHFFAIFYCIQNFSELEPEEKKLLDGHTQAVKQILRKMCSSVAAETAFASLKSIFQMLDESLIDPYVLLVLNDTKGAKTAVKKRQDFALFDSFFKQLRFLIDFLKPLPQSALQNLEQASVPANAQDLKQELLNALHSLNETLEQFQRSCRTLKIDVQTMKEIQKNFAIVLSKAFALDELLISNDNLLKLCEKEWETSLATDTTLKNALFSLQKAILCLQQDLRATTAPLHRIRDKNPEIVLYSPPPLPVLKKTTLPPASSNVAVVQQVPTPQLDPVKDTQPSSPPPQKHFLEDLLIKSHLVLAPLAALDEAENAFRQAQIHSSWGNLQILATSLFPLLEIAETDCLSVPYALSTQLQLKSALVLEQIEKLALSYSNIRKDNVHVILQYRSEHDLEKLFLELAPFFAEHNLNIDQSTSQIIAKLKNMVKIASRYPINSYSAALQEMKMLSDILYSMKQQSLSLAEEEFLQTHFPTCPFDQLEQAIQDKQKMILKDLQTQGRQCLEFAKNVLKCLPYTLEVTANELNLLPPTLSTTSAPAFPYDSIFQKAQKLKAHSAIFLQSSSCTVERKLYLFNALRNFPFYLTALRELYAKPNFLPLFASTQEQKLFFEALLLEQTFITFLALLPIHNPQNTSEHVLSTRISENRILAFSHNLEQFLNLMDNFLTQKGQTLTISEPLRNRVKILGHFLQASMRYPYEEKDGLTDALDKARHLSSWATPSASQQQTMVRLFGSDEAKWDKGLFTQRDSIEDVLGKEAFFSFELTETLLTMANNYFNK